MTADAAFVDKSAAAPVICAALHNHANYRHRRVLFGVNIGMGDCVVDDAGMPIALSKLSIKELRAEVRESRGGGVGGWGWGAYGLTWLGFDVV